MLSVYSTPQAIGLDWRGSQADIDLRRNEKVNLELSLVGCSDEWRDTTAFFFFTGERLDSNFHKIQRICTFSIRDTQKMADLLKYLT